MTTAIQQATAIIAGIVLLSAASASGLQEWSANGALTASIKAETSSTPNRILVRHPSGKKLCEGYIQDGRRTGVWLWYYENGVIRATGEYRDGRRTGRWIWRYPSNVKQAEGHFVDDAFNGLWTWWHPNGVFWSQGSFKAGALDGRWVNWYDTGRKKMEGHYKDGKMQGRFYLWHAPGKGVGRYLAKGELNESGGEWTIYHENGRVAAQGGLSDGRRHGVWNYYYDDGRTLATGRFDSGAPTGVWKTYHPNGRRWLEGDADAIRLRFSLSEIPANAPLNCWNGDIEDDRAFGTFHIPGPTPLTPFPERNPLVDPTIDFLRPVRFTRQLGDLPGDGGYTVRQQDHQEDMKIGETGGQLGGRESAGGHESSGTEAQLSGIAGQHVQPQRGQRQNQERQHDGSQPIDRKSVV